MPSPVGLGIHIGIVGGLTLNALLTMYSFGVGDEGPFTSLAAFLRYVRTLTIGTLETTAVTMVACVAAATATPTIARWVLGAPPAPARTALIGGMVGWTSAVIVGGCAGVIGLFVWEASVRRAGDEPSSMSFMVVPWLGCQSGIVAFLLGLRIGWILAR